ncbi:kinase-like domain-containing protein [Russula earlei]|uniref:Kinase-like domain-containing protein n=1 Tax=Russula earlei TaxID=71964 RepID=A0ACC0U959_9AGAM|nr:kinase-like domain-containing protein [Russula earlei]
MSRLSPDRIVDSGSAATANTALSWYLTALSNDPFFRQVPPWKNFVRVRTGDLESVPKGRTFGPVSPDVHVPMPASSSNATDIQKSRALDRGVHYGVVRGPRGMASSEDGSSLNSLREHRTNSRHSGSTLRADENVPFQVQVSDFEIISVLGIGSKAKVLLARHKSRSTGCVYALKVVAKRRVLAYQELRCTLTEQAVLRRMVNEGMNLFVVKLWLSFHDHENLYMVMDFCPGGDLRTLLDRKGCLNHDLSRFYATELVEGLEGLHAAGIIHRNLKPEHILIDKDGHIKLCGFGKSREFRWDAASPGSPGWANDSDKDKSSLQSNHTDTTSSLCGTAAYFAPEVIRGLPYSYAIDWWSLGTILYEMLTGIRPFDAANLPDMYDRILEDELRFPDDKITDQPTRNFIQRLLQRDPALRLAEPQIKRHRYFLMMDWSDVHYRHLRPPYVPPLDHSNPKDTQNFHEAFRCIKPVICDAYDLDMEHEWRRTSLESTDSVDTIATSFHPHGSPEHIPNDTDDGDYEEYSFKDQYPVIIGDEQWVPAMEKDQSGTEIIEKGVPEVDVSSEQAMVKGLQMALRLSTPPLQQISAFSIPEPLSADTIATLACGTPSVITDIPIQAPAPPTPSTDRPGANAVTAALSRHLTVPMHIPRRLLRNVKRSRHESTVAPVPGDVPDRNDDDDLEAVHGEEFDNGPRELPKVEGGNHNGPRSIKSVSKASFSTSRSSTARSRSREG